MGRGSNAGDKWMLGNQGDKDHAKDRLWPRSVDLHLLSRYPVNRQRELQSLRTSDTIALYRLNAFGPFNNVQVHKEQMSVGCQFPDTLLSPPPTLTAPPPLPPPTIP